MNYKELLFNKDKVLTFYPELAVILNKYDKILAEEDYKIGKTDKKRKAGTLGLNEAIIINQINYWNEINKKAEKSKKFKDGYYWTYNTYEKWAENDFPYWSADTIRKSITALESMGIVISTDKYNSYKIDNTKWYRIDYDRLQEIINIVEENDKENSNEKNQDEKEVSQAVNENCDCVNESYIDGLGNFNKPIPDISTENNNIDYSTENTINSFSNEKDNSKQSLDIYNSQVGELGTDTPEAAESETDKPKSNITRTFGVIKHEQKQHELKDMPTRTKEIAYELTEDEDLSKKACYCMEYFLECYKSHRHKEHPNLTEPVLKRVVNDMLSGMTERIEGKDGDIYDNDYYPLICHEVDSADFEAVIDQYFSTVFTQKTDYGICHFLDENVLPKIMNKCMLHGGHWYESHEPY